MGTYYAIVQRQFLYIPMSAIGSGGSFGFFMGIGMIMRSEMEGKVEDEGDHSQSFTQSSVYSFTAFNPRTGEICEKPMYHGSLSI